MDAIFYTVQAINGDYASLVTDDGQEHSITMFLLPEGTTLGSRLKVLHIHDNDGLADLHQIPFVFTRTRENKSSTDWEGFVRGLRAIGFDGVLNFETAPVLTAFPEELREDALRLIARIGRYLGGQISGGDR